MAEQLDIWKLLAGLGIFIFGMFLMEEAVKNLGGRSFKRFIRNFTTGRIRSILSGISVTAILQSSSAVSLMVLAFAGAGIMTMENAIGVILGSNIGTTVTSWIVAFFGFKVNIESYSLPMIGIGGLGLIFLGKSERYSNLSRLLVGFGFLFMGLDYMKTSVMELTEAFDISSLPDQGIFINLLAGLLLTAVMQSSSATMAIVLTALHAHIIGFHAAAAMVIGANVGTTVTVLLGSIGGSQTKKRVALSHLVFNVFSAIVGLAMLPLSVILIEKMIGSPSENAVIGVAIFHTFFNVVGVLIFLPLIGLMAKLLIKVYPDRKATLTQYIHNTTPEVSDAAMEGLRQEVRHLIKEVMRYDLKAIHVDTSLVFEEDRIGRSSGKKQTLEDRYDHLKHLQAAIFSFATKIYSSEIEAHESTFVDTQLHAARSALHAAKTIKDVIHNLEEFENSDNSLLNEENALFRKRMLSLYMLLNEAMQHEDHSETASILAKCLNRLKAEDEQFVRSVSAATGSKRIQDLEITNLLMVNRAIIQSSQQLVEALSELQLERSEKALFDSITEDV